MNTPKLQPVIGLEIHVQLHTQSKLFCACSTATAEPNSHVCPICLGHPGAKPILNKKALDFAIQIAMALHCAIQPRFVFSRKTYFYPDLSKNYQITQFEFPLGLNGYLELDSGKKIRIKRVHLEEDPAALVHEKGYSLADYNRSGIPLAEIVTEPDLSSPSEAREFMDKLLNLLNFLGVFEQGTDTLKADSNISLKGFERVEVKNVSGFRSIEKALEYEIERQSQLVERGEKIVRETRGYKEENGSTYSLRTKESEEDYGYITDPDLTPLMLTTTELKEIQQHIPELPQQKSQRFQKTFGLTAYDANVLCSNKTLSEWFEAIAPQVNAKRAAVFLTREILGIINYNKLEISALSLDSQALLGLIQILEKGQVSEKNAKQAAIEYVLKGILPKQFLEQKGLLMDLPSQEMKTIVQEALKKNPQAVAELRAGNTKSLNYLVGIIMRQTKGKADPRKIQQLIEQQL